MFIYIYNIYVCVLHSVYYLTTLELESFVIGNAVASIIMH